MEDKQETYSSFSHQDWYELLSTIEAKDNRKRAATKIKNIASSRADSLSDSNYSLRIPRKKKARTGACLNRQGEKRLKQHRAQHYYVICAKSGMHE